MNVLSLFNGMSFGKMALESLSVPVTKYYSSEIDKYANQATQAMLPNTIQLGDVTQWREWDIDWAGINLVTGGFPCQAWSMAGKQLGDKDERGMLFWTMLDIMKHVKYHNPKADFLIENVKMKKEFEQYITTHTENALGKVHKILINSALVSAQNRNRYYWTSFAVGQPEDKEVMLKDIIEHDCEAVNSDGWHKWWHEKSDFQLKKKYSTICNDGSTSKAITMTARQFASWNGSFVKCAGIRGRYLVNGVHQDAKQKTAGLTQQYIEPRKDDKTNTLTTVKKDNVIAEKAERYRNLTPRECFRLQTVPEHHIDTLLSSGISNTQLYKMCGNGWTMEVIKHIFNTMLNKGEELCD
jgi:DNA-cytosine methyltransferase